MATRTSAVASGFGAATSIFEMVGDTASAVGKTAKIANNYMEQILYEQETMNQYRRITFSETALQDAAAEAARREWALKEEMGTKLTPEAKNEILATYVKLLNTKRENKSS